jgi:hypothetical protein
MGAAVSVAGPGVSRGPNRSPLTSESLSRHPPGKSLAASKSPSWLGQWAWVRVIAFMCRPSLRWSLSLKYASEEVGDLR